MRVISKGQITIPLEIRRQAEITVGSKVEFHYENGRVWVEKKLEDLEVKRARIHAAIEALRGSVTANPDLSTDDIMVMTRGDDS